MTAKNLRNILTKVEPDKYKVYIAHDGIYKEIVTVEVTNLKSLRPSKRGFMGFDKTATGAIILRTEV